MATYSVDGMTCQGCAAAVTRAIMEKIPGARVNVDLGAKTVRVDGAAEAGTVKAAIEDAGFEFKGPAA